jgi:hypothetical protein
MQHLKRIVSFCRAENIAREKGKRPPLGVHRWDMYSGKGPTKKREVMEPTLQ